MPRFTAQALTIEAAAADTLRAQGWAVESTVGPAAEVHDRVFQAPTPPTMLINTCDRPAAVIGSSQPDDQINRQRAERLGLDVCRRRSGGGLVVVEPGASIWIDLVIPPTHRLWIDDVTSSFDWLGQLWAATLSAQGVGNVEVHRGRLVNADHGRIVCFAGLGPGEVLAAGRKVVGLSQRRGRFGARFQCLFLRYWPGELTRQLLQPDAVPPGLNVEGLLAGLHSAPNPNRSPDPSDQAILDQFISGLAGLEVS